MKNLIFLLLLLFPFRIYTQEKDFIPVPPLTGRVVDLTETLSPAEIRSLSSRLEAIEKVSGVQIVIVLISTTGTETIEEYSLRLAETWKIGRKGYDDGLIILVAKNDRKARIEVGYGLEGVIPDAAAKRILVDVMFPEFKKGNFYEGLKKGIEAIHERISGEITFEETPSGKDKEKEGDSSIFWIVTPAFVSFFLQSFIGTVFTTIISSLFFGILYTLLFGFHFEILFLIFLFSFLGALGFRRGSGFYPARGGYFGSSFPSGIPGTFSGGGGSFGGGGASGNW